MNDDVRNSQQGQQGQQGRCGGAVTHTLGRLVTRWGIVADERYYWKLTEKILHGHGDPDVELERETGNDRWVYRVRTEWDLWVRVVVDWEGRCIVTALPPRRGPVIWRIRERILNEGMYRPRGDSDGARRARPRVVPRQAAGAV